MALDLREMEENDLKALQKRKRFLHFKKNDVDRTSKLSQLQRPIELFDQKSSIDEVLETTIKSDEPDVESQFCTICSSQEECIAR
ncbi:unnamed protein product, partial [Onchocerca ochengi]